jgi:hypothetical protein
VAVLALAFGLLDEPPQAVAARQPATIMIMSGAALLLGWLVDIG